jgi:hypothetical protein
LALALSVVIARGLLAQVADPPCCGVIWHRGPNHVAVSFVWATDANPLGTLPDRLVAAVLWRAATRWDDVRAPADAKRAREMADSALRAATARGAAAGGTLNALGNAWLEIDRSTRALRLAGRGIAAPTRDSIRVILVDHVDEPRRTPSITSFALPAPLGPLPVPRAVNWHHEGTWEGRDRRVMSWTALLERDPRIQRFAGITITN